MTTCDKCAFAHAPMPVGAGVSLCIPCSFDLWQDQGLQLLTVEHAMTRPVDEFRNIHPEIMEAALDWAAEVHGMPDGRARLAALLQDLMLAAGWRPA